MSDQVFKAISELVLGRIPDIASFRFRWNRVDGVHTRTPYQHFVAI